MKLEEEGDEAEEDAMDGLLQEQNDFLLEGLCEGRACCHMLTSSLFTRHLFLTLPMNPNLTPNLLTLPQIFPLLP